MNDDLHKLVDDQLPRLAYQIMRPVWEIGTHFNNGRWNFLRSANWDDLDGRKALYYAGPVEIDGQNGFRYTGRWPVDQRSNRALMKQWFIAFHGFRSKGLGDIPDTPVVVDPGAVTLMQVDKTANNGPGFLDYKIVRHEERDTAHEKSVGALAELEYKRSLRALVKGGIPGVGEAEVETTTELRARVEAQTHAAWKASDTLANTVEASYQVYPYHQLTVSVERGNPRVRQTIPMSHDLDCSVTINVYGAFHDITLDSLEDVAETWRGVRPGPDVLVAHFAQHPVDPSGWVRPNAKFDLVLEADRVRYSDVQYDHVPIPGKEALAQRYVDAKRKAIAS